MEIKSLYREIVNEHNLYPGHKYDLENPTMVLQGINPSCGDDINLQLRIEDDIITDASFNGSGCAISQASADMMIDLIIGKRKEEALRLAETFMGMIKGTATALRLAETFMGMIKGTATADQIENLEEAAALQDISHMPARVKCAVLGWRTMRQMLEEINK